MTVAYDRDYLEDAMYCMAEAFDYVANACQMDLGMFIDMFISTGFAARFEEAECSVVSGMSGTELVRAVMRKSGLELSFPAPIVELGGVSNEFWCGWFLAYFQWFSNRPFKNILKHIELEDFMMILPDFIEDSEERRQEKITMMISDFNEPVRLQNMRRECGISQRRLAEMADINIRTLQQYEIRTKDINKAAAVSVISAAKSMGCSIEDILEYKQAGEPEE